MSWHKKLFHYLAVIFGHMSWRPPEWLVSIYDSFMDSPVGDKLDDLVYFIKHEPKQAAVRGGVLAILLGGLGYGGYRVKMYFDSLPQPDYVQISASAPYPTDPLTKEIHPLTISFSKSAAPLDQIGKEVTDGVSISPSIAGVWTWKDDRTLNFQPKGAVPFKTDWLVGTEYKVSFDKSLFPGHLDFKSYHVRFNSQPLSFYFSKQEYYIDPRQPKIKKVIATLVTTQPMNVEDFKKRISMKLQPADDSALGMSGQTLAPKLTFNSQMTEAYIESPGLEMPSVDHVALIKLAKGLQSLRGGEAAERDLSTKIQVPGLYSAFKINDLKIIFARNEKFEPEQVLVFGSGIAARSEDIRQAMKVHLLPADHKPRGQKKPIKNYSWQSASEVTASIRNELEPVELEMLPTEEAYSPEHSFKLKVPVNRSLLIEIKGGIKGLGDYELGKDYQAVVRVPDYTPELMFMSEGAILSLSGDKRLPLLARNLGKVKFELGRVLPSQVNFLIAKMSSSDSFSSPNFYDDVEDFIMERFHETQKLPRRPPAETVYFSLDMKPHIKDGRGFFYIKVFSEETGTQDKRLIMMTDLGLIAKQNASGGTAVYVQNLRSGQPVENAEVEIIGQNGLPILSQETDGSGRASFPKLEGYDKEKKPLAFVARKGGDVSYLPYRMNQRQLVYSRFDTGGLVEDSESDQLSGMLFSDRGLYRPGDKVNIGVILRSKTPAAAKNLPLIISVIDPRGSTIRREKLPVKMFGLQDFDFVTRGTSPTGAYTVQLILIKKQDDMQIENVITSTTVQVEEFVPDKLKIQAQLTPFKSKGWIPLEKLQARVSLKNLFGTAAENRMIKSEVTITPINPSVAKFKEYAFVNPNKKDSHTASEALPDKATDAKGETFYDIDLSKYQGYFMVRFKTEGFEAAGGRGVETQAGIIASQWTHLVGFKADGGLNYIKKDGERNVELIAIDSDQEPSETSVQLALNGIRYVSTLVKQNDGTYKYQSVKKESELKSEEKKIGKDGLKLSLPTNEPGDFVYVVKNTKGDEINRVEFKVVGEANLTRSLDRNAELQLALNKEDYKAGEEIEIQIVAPYHGAGLITIERDTVYAHKWFKTNSNTTVEKIKIPDTMTGNAYVNVTFLRDIDSKEIYMSPLSYGVRSFSISLEEQRTKIELTAPEKVKPGEEIAIKYSANRSTSLIIYGVDEGILQVARYKLPDPLQYFFRKRALQVETFQLLDLLLPEYSLLQQNSSTGGDTGEAFLKENLNPFKAKGLAPVVFWSGVLSAGEKSKTFTYKVPDYFNGNIKIMAVASASGGLGSVESGTLARGDFIITPTVPVFITPSDEIQVGVNVSNQVENKDSSTDVKVSVETSRHLEIMGDGQKSLNIPQGRELGTEFKFKAAGSLGAAQLSFAATNGKESATFKHEVSVRPAMPYMTTINTGLTSTLPLQLNVDRQLYPEYGEISATMSPSPLAVSDALLTYLSDFPHGCTEQIVSQTIPSLYAASLKSSKDKKEKKKSKKKAGKKKKKGKGKDKETEEPEEEEEKSDEPVSPSEAHSNLIAMLRTRQTSDGGFSLYGNSNDSHVASSLYAIQYLIEAQDREFDTPDDMAEKIREFLQSAALRKADSLTAARAFAQAVYLQARYGLVPGNDLNFLRELLEKNFNGQWEKDSIAVFMAGTYELLQEKEKGWSLVSSMTLGETSVKDYANYYDPLIRDAYLINIIAKHYPDKLDDYLDTKAIRVLLKPLMNQQYNTVSAAQLIIAFANLNTAAEKKGWPGALRITEFINDKETVLPFSKGLLSKALVSLDAQRVSFSGREDKSIFYSLVEKGFDRNPPKEETKKGIEVSRVFENASGSTVSKVKMGDEIHVVLRLRGLDKVMIPYVVLVDLFPAGFELVRESATTGNADYIDQREDRMVVYTYATKDMQEYKYKLKATHKGKFMVPPVFGESLYDKAVVYRGMAGHIDVE